MSTTPLSRLLISLKTHNAFSRSAFQTVCFSTRCTLRAVRRPSRAPVHAFKGRLQAPIHKPEPEEVRDTYFWPTELLHTANSAGGLSLRSNDAIHFLTKFRDSQPSPGSESMRNLCLDYEIEPLTLTILANILRRSRLEHCQATARSLILAASYLHDSGATLQLVNEAIRNSTLTHPDIIGPRTHLEILVKKHKNPAAMILLGRIREAQEKPDEALRLYERATNADSNTYTGVEAVDDSIGDAWVKMSRLKLKKNDVQGSQAAIEKGAFQYDEPMAYYYLATICTAPDSADYLRYLMKAAASGVAEAAQCLGVYYEAKWKKALDIRPREEGSTEGEVKAGSLSIKETSIESIEEPENRQLALEWFTVAAEAGLPRSRISLAILLRSLNFVQKGMDWLNLEEFPADWADGVAMLKESWWDPENDLTRIPIDQLQRSKM